MSNKARTRLSYETISIPPSVNCMLSILLFTAKGIQKMQRRGKGVYELQDEETKFNLHRQILAVFLEAVNYNF